MNCQLLSGDDNMVFANRQKNWGGPVLFKTQIAS